MKYLLDTVVVSEYIRRKPVQSVIDWLDQQDEQDLFLSVLTIAELKKGAYKLANGKPESGNQERARKILDWIQTLEQRFQGRILAVDSEVLSAWATMCGAAEAEGRKLPVIDSLLAATAKWHSLSIVTRNVDDFQNCSATVALHNPY